MAFRKKVKDYKAQFKEGTRRIFRGEPSSVQPTESVPNLQISSSSTIPVPSSLASPGVTNPILIPRSVPPSAKSAGLDASWKCLKDFVQVLDTGSGILGPLKLVMDDLAHCFALHEVSLFVIQYWEAHSDDEFELGRCNGSTGLCGAKGTT